MLICLVLWVYHISVVCYLRASTSDQVCVALRLKFCYFISCFCVCFYFYLFPRNLATWRTKEQNEISNNYNSVSKMKKTRYVENLLPALCTAFSLLISLIDSPELPCIVHWIEIRWQRHSIVKRVWYKA